MTLVFDREGAVDRVDNDVELLLELVEMATSDAVTKIASVRAALSAQDCKVVSETAHSMKSAFGNVGAMVCHAICYDIERKGKSGLCDGVEELIISLENGMKDFLSAIEEFKKNG